MDTFLNRRTAAITVGLITLWKSYLAAVLQLHPDEAYYWLWSRYLDLGYYDHAPLVAYVIRLTTLFSQSEFWVRFSGIAGTLLMSVLVWKLALQLFGKEKTAAASVITFNVLPLTISGSIIITPDIPAFFFWALSVYCAWQIVRTRRASSWYLLAACFGLSLLSKYTAVLFAPSLFLFLLFSDERRWLKTVHPYAAFAVGLLFFLPVIYWNRAHDWISFRFQLQHGMGSAQYTLKWIGEYIGGQMLITSPVLWLAGMYAAFVFLFRKNKEKLFLSLMALPIILFFAYSSLKKPAGPNWPVFGYFAFSILVSAFLFGGGKVKKFLWGAGVALSLAMTALVTVHARWGIVPMPHFSREWAVADATNWFYGWKELGEELLKQPGLGYTITPSHQISAELMYYTGGKIFSYVDLKRTRPSQFNFWRFPPELKGRPARYVDVVEGKRLSNSYKNCFASVGTTRYLTVRRWDFPIRTYRIIEAQGYAQ